MKLHKLNLLYPIRQTLNTIKISNHKQAELLCQLIPGTCPFARNIKFFNHVIAHIPPLCKLNPLYEELMGLRFRALCYLAAYKHQRLDALAKNTLALVLIKQHINHS
ncbi:Mo-dependent nitrogenase C-terminal domain-containing protein [Nostoc sp. UHCC 0302]|uniref:Mo-dependent nitrogenase C-terminal domain-containing protein n=1 Tax=Nostoc sp. UHCC 0302 TaxID=3134896 RepID=UPI00311CD8A8